MTHLQRPIAVLGILAYVKILGWPLWWVILALLALFVLGWYYDKHWAWPGESEATWTTNPEYQRFRDEVLNGRREDHS